MKFHIGPIPESPDFAHDAPPWRGISDTSPWMLQILSLPLSFVTCAIFAYLWFTYTPLTLEQVFAPSLWAFFLLIIGVIITHELLHAAAFPTNQEPGCVVLGFWPSRFAFFAHFHGEMSRNRFLFVLLTPLAIISVLPLLLSARTGMIKGTPFYMAPEQIQNPKSIDARADLFALGVILYELCSGQMPFQGESREKLLVSIVMKEPTPLPKRTPPLPASLRKVIMRLLEKDPAKRFQSAQEVRQALKQVLRKEKVLGAALLRRRRNIARSTS